MNSGQLNLTGRLMSDMDPDLLDFLKYKVNSFIKWDMMRFFHDNPHTADTVENIARYAGRSAEALPGGLKELARDDVLVESQVGQMRIYELSRDPNIRRLLKMFVEASNDRQFRVKAIYHIVRGNQ